MRLWGGCNTDHQRLDISLQATRTAADIYHMSIPPPSWTNRDPDEDDDETPSSRVLRVALIIVIVVTVIGLGVGIFLGHLYSETLRPE